MRHLFGTGVPRPSDSLSWPDRRWHQPLQPALAKQLFMPLAAATFTGAASMALVLEKPAHQAWLWVMFVWVLLFLGTTPLSTVPRLKALWAVSVARRLPRAWHPSTLQDHRGTLASNLALAALALSAIAAVVALPSGVGNRLALVWALVAWVALFMAWQLVLASTWHRLLRHLPGWGSALVLGGVSVAGSWGGLFLSAPPWLLVFAWLSLPLAVACLHRNLQGEQQAPDPDIRTPHDRPRWALWRGRLALPFRRVDDGLQIGVVGFLLSQMPFAWSTAYPDARVLVPMGTSLTWAHGLRLTVITWTALMVLQVSALHWRHLLAPGGARVRRQLAWRIFGATVVSLTGWLAAVLLGTVLVRGALSHLGLSDPFSLKGLAPLLLPLLSDALLATAAAVWLRALAGTQARALLCLAGLAMAAGLGMASAHALQVLPWPLPVLGHRGPAWLGLQAALTVGLLVLAQRAWARVDQAAQVVLRA